MHLSNGVILDKSSLDRGDLDFSCLDSLVENWQTFESTQAENTLSRIENADIIITNKVVINAQMMKQAKKLKLICIAATGTNNVDLNAAKENNIVVCNVTAYATASVVQHVFTLILALQTHLLEYVKLVQNNVWDQSKHFCLLNYPITELSGKTLGIIGFGELGKAVANAASAFGLKVIVAQSLTGNLKPNRVELNELLAQSDILSLHCPLTAETENLINQQTLALMKPSSILINAARGGVVNEADLLYALQHKVIAAAGIDVLHQEPPNNNALIQAQLPNLIITPHIAWASQASRQRLVDQICDNIKAYLSNSNRNQVNN